MLATALIVDESTDTPSRADRRRPVGGMLIIGVIVVAAFVIISLDEILAARTPMVDLHAELPESGGLVAGAPVWIAGNEVGEVVAVTLLPPDYPGDSRIVAIARIPRAHLPLLRQDTRATLASARLMGDPALELSPGSPEAPGLRESDTIAALYTPRRFAATIASTRRVLLEADSLMTQLRQVGALYRARRPMIDEVMRSVDLASAELDRTAIAWSESPLASAMSDAQLGARLDRVRQSLATVQQGLGRYTSGPLGAQIAALRLRTDSVRADVALLDSLASDPNAGFVGRMRTDSALTVELGRTTAQMDTLMEEVLSNPFMFF